MTRPVERTASRQALAPALLLGLPMLLLSAASGCTFYTSCPTEPPSAASGASSSGGSSSTGGRGGTDAGDAGDAGDGNNYEDRAWVSATGSLEGRSVDCGVVYLSGNPAKDELIAGLYQDGLWSNTEGTDWVALGAEEGSATITNGVNSIIYDPDDRDVFWEAGIYFGGGAYRTDDGGALFEQLGDLGHLDSISIDFTDPSRATLLAGPHEKAGLVFKSTDGGATWNPIMNLPPDLGHSANVLVQDAQTYLVGCTSGIIRTTDGGDSWTIVSNLGGARLPLVASDGNIYWNIESNQGLVRSKDGGESFEQVADGSMLDKPNAPVGLPDGRVASLYADHVVISADEGVTWKPIGAPLPHEAKGFTYAPLRKAFYISTDSCNAPIPADAIMKLDFDYETE